ncbi:MAG: hypothetical protein ACRD1R_02555 [Acidobacteriota bacterium]
MANKVLFCVYVLYCFEVGIFLLVFPWMRLWDQNSLLQIYPQLRLIFLNNFFRGAVSGLGMANLILGVWEVAHFQYYFKKA